MNTPAAKREENVMYKYLRSMEMEKKRRPNMNYMKILQKDITVNMRGNLIDWLAQVAQDYKLLPDTLYLTVSYMDRFLSFHPIRRTRHQLLGISSMYIASMKILAHPMWKIYALLQVINTTEEEVLEMENKILKTLDFDLSNPTVKTFRRRLNEIAVEKNNASRLQFEFLTDYLAELSLLDYDCLRFLPSLVAASVVFLARIIVWPKSYPWTTALQEYSEYKPVELKECVLALHDLHVSKRGASFKAIRKKYKKHEFQYVANLPSPPHLPSYLFEEIQ